MSHKLLTEDIKESSKKQKQFNIGIPNLTGKFGFSIFAAKREIFIGISVGEVEIEQIVRRRMVKIPKKGVVKVFQID